MTSSQSVNALRVAGRHAKKTCSSHICSLQVSCATKDKTRPSDEAARPSDEAATNHGKATIACGVHVLHANLASTKLPLAELRVSFCRITRSNVARKVLGSAREVPHRICPIHCYQKYWKVPQMKDKPRTLQTAAAAPGALRHVVRLRVKSSKTLQQIPESVELPLI